jgi:molybdate transport system substrate-binding protein
LTAGCIAILVVVGVIVTGCAPQPAAPVEPARLTVFAAASLTDVFEAAGQVYEKAHPETEVVFNFAASSALRTQIQEGAAADVAAFASEKDMQVLVESGLANGEAAQIFAGNELVLVVHPDRPAVVGSLEDLAKPGVKVVIAADGVPARDYARQVLTNLGASLGAGFAPAVLANVVSEEDNVRQVLAKVQLGEADAGWVYRSDAQVAAELGVIEIPPEANVRARYPIAVLLAAPHPQAAQAFVDLVLSAEGQRLIAEGGLLPVAP